ncbi:DUF7674 family protein [Streptomyces avidinii]
MMRGNWWEELLQIDAALTAKVDQGLPFTFQLASFGNAFVALSASISRSHQERILYILEEVMATGDEADVAAVATGFFEALLDKWDEGYDLEALWPAIGPESRSHCLSWNSMWGISSPGWMRLK